MGRPGAGRRGGLASSVRAAEQATEAISARIRVSLLKQDVDRNGNRRTYLAMPGRRKVRIRADVGTPECWTEYHTAIEGVTAPSADSAAPEDPAQPAAT